jgi:predicted site-specific integrase-resolvase
MQNQFPTHSIITDIGSGINFKRKGLRTILELAMSGAISEVVVAYRDRLCRFAFELVEWILQYHKVKLVVLNQTLEGETTDRSELAEDLLAIINVFNCRINGKRKYKKKANQQSS